MSLGKEMRQVRWLRRDTMKWTMRWANRRLGWRILVMHGMFERAGSQYPFYTGVKCFETVRCAGRSSNEVSSIDDTVIACSRLLLTTFFIQQFLPSFQQLHAKASGREVWFVVT